MNLARSTRIVEENDPAFRKWWVTKSVEVEIRYKKYNIETHRTIKYLGKKMDFGK